ncbi:hypothetical protein [Salinimicrobium oceani]|uniref:NlpE N-terminal domain-containing protein n=1 Tax=Salinimicrobium oceani TaxID=2722702 RepID=A0ABX1D2K1_9FLAO|nr:hypothetical protein [Salinimicrobium oceani]NJW52913.1 hypothetical protein [Salinimicrobium oceani]
MKKHLFGILVALIFISCGEENNPNEEVVNAPVAEKDSIPTITGEFIFLSDAAVLKGKNFIYGVQIDSISKRLADSVAPLKRDEFHMIPVTVKGKIINNSGREGWEELVVIKEILEISPDAMDTTAPRVTQDLERPR